MIYVSSACVKNNSIADSVEQLAKEGFLNIELSGGTQFYEGFEKDLLKLRAKYNLNYLCHNYFPPPETAFVVNVASLDKEIVEMSLKHLKKAILLTKKLGATKFGFHAGFLINIPVNQIGKSINAKELFDRNKALTRFVENIKVLKSVNPEIDLYIENNVLANMNFDNFGKINPFFLCDTEGFNELNRLEKINLLLDVAHLKVSCQTLHQNFELELSHLISQSNYIHISDNDGTKDSNNTFSANSELFNQLKNYTFEDKIITLEVYDGIPALHESYDSALKLYK
ncbi:sugar phosphate isomerase/epimerase [Crocinitomix sp.]|nr:sugar phosphate isomerase/epimerase [Crocinitomix sp.]